MSLGFAVLFVSVCARVGEGRGEYEGEAVLVVTPSKVNAGAGAFIFWGVGSEGRPHPVVA